LARSVIILNLAWYSKKALRMSLAQRSAGRIWLEFSFMNLYYGEVSLSTITLQKSRPALCFDLGVKLFFFSGTCQGGRRGFAAGDDHLNFVIVTCTNKRLVLNRTVAQLALHPEFMFLEP